MNTLHIITAFHIKNLVVLYIIYGRRHAYACDDVNLSAFSIPFLALNCTNYRQPRVASRVLVCMTVDRSNSKMG